jgi:hypothetical protein
VGGPASRQGLPTSDETSFGDGVGRYNVFANNNSAIVWHPTTGPMVTQGAIHAAWVNQGSGQGPLGYPTSDEIALGNGAAYSDFQNGVLYWDGTRLVSPSTAGLTGEQMGKMLRTVFLEEVGSADFIEFFSLYGVSTTGYDFLQGGSRQDTFYLEGKAESLFSNDYVLHLTLRFLTQREADGTTSLRMVTTAHSIVTTINFVERIAGISPDMVIQTVEDYFVPKEPKKLIDSTIPAAVNVLSFKVQPDGGIRLYLQPGSSAASAAQNVQDRLNDRLR